MPDTTAPVPAPGIGAGHATRVLLVEDDPNIVDLIRSNLLVRGYEVEVSRTGVDVLRLTETEPHDVVLLDLMLPQADGFELCRALREHSGVGIIVISARGGEGDKVRALNLGADDYMTKPFGIEELLARITATLRRTRPAAAPVAEAPGRVEAGDVVIDLDARLVTKAGERVHLTPTELALLRELALSPRVLLGHAQLLRRVWGAGYERETEYLRVYVRRLRAKLDTPGAPTLIVTEPRLGYRFEPPP
jgi:two-component system KDP operon response regulator KdpE